MFSLFLRVIVEPIGYWLCIIRVIRGSGQISLGMEELKVVLVEVQHVLDQLFLGVAIDVIAQ